MNQNQHLRGFSLIELMIAVAILSLLASMAVPGYERYILNAKKTERTILTKNLASDIRGYFDRNEGEYVANFPLSPGLPATNQKKPFVVFGLWNQINFLPPGTNVYYHYNAFGYQTATEAYFVVSATGDLDANGVPSNYQEEWIRTTDKWSLVSKTTNETEW